MNESDPATDEHTVHRPTRPGDPSVGVLRTVLEAAFSVAALLAGTLGPVYQLRLWMGPMQGAYADDRRVMVGFALMYLIAAILGCMARRRVDLLPVLTTIGLMALLVLSSAWSIDIRLSLQQSVLALLTIALPWYLARRWTASELLTLAWLAVSIGVGLSALAITAGRNLAIDAAGDWAGIYFNRNSLGPVAGLCVVLGSLQALQGPAFVGATWRLSARLVAAGSVLVAAILLVGSGSKTSMIATGATLGVWALVEAVRRVMPGRRVRVWIWGALGASAAAGVLLFRPVATALGSDPTLQGRTELWGYLAGRFRERPLLGDGWMATYTSEDYWYWGVKHLSLNVQTAHNGVLEVAVGAGLVALAALVTIYWFGFDRSVRDASRARVGTLIVAVYFTCANATETFIGANHLVWVLFLACCVFRWTREHPGDTAIPDPQDERADSTRRG